MKKAAFCIILLTLAIFLAGALPAAAAYRYTYTDLGHLTPFDDKVLATAINASGQVVGRTESPDGLHAFLYSGGVLQDLGTLPGHYGAAATGINDAGQVVGYSFDASESRAFLWSSETGMQNLGTLDAPYNAYSYAYGINNAGQVVGTSCDPLSYGRAFLYSGGKMQDLGALPDHIASGASAINAAGQVVGASVDLSGYSHAFLWSGGVMQNLGTLPAPYNVAACTTAINAVGQVAGFCANSDNIYRPFLYSGGGMLALGPVPTYQSYAYGLNAAGQVVGEFDYRAFVYAGGVMQELYDLVKDLWASLYYTLREARGIDDRGQIIAQGINGSQWRALLLTPIRPSAALDLLLLD